MDEETPCVKLKGWTNIFDNGISPYFEAFLLSLCAISPRELPVCASLYTFPTMREGGGGTPIQKRKKRYKVLGQNLIKPRQHSCSIVKVLNSASEMKILQDVTDLWTMNITFYKEKLNPLSSLMTGATYWCKKQTAIVLVSDRQRNAASQKLS